MVNFLIYSKLTTLLFVYVKKLILLKHSIFIYLMKRAIMR